LLFLVFHVDHDRYAIEAEGVIEILPLVRVKQIPVTPSGVAGLLEYRGDPVPVIDLCQLMLDRPSRRCHSTRIVVVRYPDAEGAIHPLALIAEKATTTLRRDRADFVGSGVASDDAAYLGPVVSDEQGLVQWIEVRKLLRGPVRDALFRRASAGEGGPAAAGTGRI
jgi:chemotaxis-related protein WspB